MNRRYMMKATFSSAMLLSITGCLTAKLYQSFPPSEYDETATSFLVTEDGATCAVLGATYHYVFDITRSLRHVLMSSLRTVVNVQLSNFYVRRNNVVTGDYTLSLSENASDEQRQSAFDAGFATDNTPGPALSGHLEGIRYSADGFPQIDRTHEFTRPYVVKITEQEPASRLAAKILLTPITVAADGLILGGILLVVLLGGVGFAVPVHH